MGAAKLDVVVEQGAEFALVINVVGGPGSIAGYTGSMQVRKTRPGEVLFEVDPVDITIDSVNRQVVLRIDYKDTAGFDWDSAVYDLYITSSDEADAYRIAEGKIKVDHWVTREAA